MSPRLSELSGVPSSLSRNLNEALVLGERLLKLRAQRGVLARESVTFVAEILNVGRFHSPKGNEPQGICSAPFWNPQPSCGLEDGEQVPGVKAPNKMNSVNT